MTAWLIDFNMKAVDAGASTHDMLVKTIGYIRHTEKRKQVE